ncbi:tryptophan synthase, beta subunit [Schinkia azotoformans MEV2011]|uniref:Tryptophan synthase beta chain n=1 Tax=Schinkia azotoformans MEV2011 TaxID=1348973 RepID=A0A072NTL4_SCHAZ|nr:tryptophan synthase subunit beta [Schinkia azotoformans]KEF36555.1 tryptophan synthase, beta subunit [Schinkia azotoformans MEV2011]MEC1696969.1 tryptophan synthase subunit beta [Schinkia azotoformans]MEC1725825.1 tryptophan synthase subunit beta [Schinkia azotoformans]MEC1772917.1 tryptophan synthase subunit beta [Schinkia azotoformans]MEC1778291.1 tryptophan synthase subunit beta [Schinkia azotoformans]
MSGAQTEQKGFYGNFGGSFVPPELQEALNYIEEQFNKYKDDKEFNDEFKYYLKEYVGRENPLTFARNLTAKLGGAKIYLKREDLNHMGAHKVNNVLGQILLAKRMGAKRVIAETGAGQHGVATAMGCAMFNMECVIYMGIEDTKRQALNVFRMEMLGAKVVAVSNGQGRLKEAVDEALNDLIANYENTFYLLGSAVGPHPYPAMVKHFQSIISEESKRQILEKEGRLPDAVVACVGGGSNAIGAFAHYIDEPSVRLIGVEPDQAATISEGVPAVIHGFKTLTLLDEEGNPRPTFSIAAGLDYPGVGPEHSYLHEIGRAEYYKVSNDEVLDAFQLLCKTEGIIPALESTHAVAYAIKLAPQMKPDDIIIVNLSGRGDKDVQHVYNLLEERNK